jgi:nitronate monooxygenase
MTQRTAIPPSLQSIDTPITRMLGIRLPIIAAPMFLVSNVDLVVAVAEAGGIAAFPSLNYRPIEAFREAVREIKRRTSKPFGVNLVMKLTPRFEDDCKICLEEGVPLLITSLGNPTQIIKDARANGTRVFCDVVNLKHALKVRDAGADAVIAVSSGAGGHAGEITPFVFVPYLREKLDIPIIAAGGIATGGAVAAALALGADAAYIGTRFIASTEATAGDGYKEMIVRAEPEDIIYTSEISGTHGNFLRESVERYRAENLGGSWANAWSAGQNVGLIHDVRPARQIMADLVHEYLAARFALPGLAPAPGKSEEIPSGKLQTITS